LTRRFYINGAPQLTLASPITSGATSCTVSGSFSGYPVSFPFSAALDKGTASFEVVSVTAIVGTTATIVRAQDGTSAVSHPAGATLDFVVIAKDFDEANAHVNASTGVHGISGAVVGTTDSQTLSNKTLASPVLTGTQTGSGAINVSGAVTSGAAVSGASVAATGAVTGASVAATGAVTGASAAITGAVTAGSVSANGNGTVTGALVPKTYTNEAAATTAIPSPTTGTMVWLTTPTTAGTIAGPFFWNGSAWTQYEPGTWIDYTPVLTNSTAGTTVTNSASAGRYALLGKTVLCKGNITASASSTTGAAVSLPFTARDRDLVAGAGAIYGTSPPAQSGNVAMLADKARIVAVSTTFLFADIVSGQNFRWNVAFELP
jgi:hypothetical protein